MKQQITLELPEGVEFDQKEIEILTSGALQLLQEAATFRRGDGSGSAALRTEYSFGKLRGARVLKDAEVRSRK
jgi:hypothetical protein